MKKCKLSPSNGLSSVCSKRLGIHKELMNGSGAGAGLWTPQCGGWAGWVGGARGAGPKISTGPWQQKMASPSRIGHSSCGELPCSDLLSFLSFKKTHKTAFSERRPSLCTFAMFSSNAQMFSSNAPQILKCLPLKLLKCSRSPAHLSDRTFFDQSPSQLTNECSHQSHLQRTEKYFKNCLSNQTFSLLRMFSGGKDALWPSLKSEL